MCGSHQHEPDEERKLLKLEKKKQRIECKQVAQRDRAERMKEQEEKRKKKAEELALRKAAHVAEKAYKADLSLDQIMSMPQTTTFDSLEFDIFDDNLISLIEKVKEQHGEEADSLMRDWNVQKQRVKAMATRRDRKKDKRFTLLRKRHETMEKEKAEAKRSKEELETVVTSFDVASCQGMLNQLADLQHRISKSQRNRAAQEENQEDLSFSGIQIDGDSNITPTRSQSPIAAIINGQIIPVELANAGTTVSMVGVCNSTPKYLSDSTSQTRFIPDYKALDRAAAQLSITQYASGIHRNETIATRMALASFGHSMPAIPVPISSQANSSASVLYSPNINANTYSVAQQAQSSNLPTTSYSSLPSVSVDVRQQNVQHLQPQQHPIQHYSQSGQQQRLGNVSSQPNPSSQHREPQVILFEGTPLGGNAPQQRPSWHHSN